MHRRCSRCFIVHAPSMDRKSNRRCVLPFLEVRGIMPMSANPREHLPSLQSENFCQDMRKMHVKTFVKRA